jgi:hypothetical protein
MNFSTERMAKQLDLPSKAYLTELKKQKPDLFNRLSNEYNANFSRFFTDIAARLRSILVKELDVSAFIENCAKEFKRRNDFEKEMAAPKVEVSSSESEGPVLKRMRAQAVGDYVWSDDESPIPPSGTVDTRLVILQGKYENLQHDFEVLNERYSLCKVALAKQLKENEMLRAELEQMKKNCFCQEINQVIKKHRD